MKKMINRYMLYIAIGILILVVAIGGFTYAFFQRQSTQTGNNVISTIDCVGINFVEHTDSINLGAAFPLTDAQGLATAPFNFTLSNECDTFTEFMIIASIIGNNNNIPDSYVKVALDGDAQVNPITLSNLPQADPNLPITGAIRSFELASGSFRSSGQSANYSFRMWLDGEQEAIWTNESLRTRDLQVRITVVGIARRDNSLTGLILANNTLRDGTPDFTTTVTNDNRDVEEGMWRVPDEHGEAYVFRGTHHGLNNNVIFAGHQWKILRIEGNGNIRMIYNGVCPDNNCMINGNIAENDATIGNRHFNNLTFDIRSVGYMFGDVCNTFENCHANINNSLIKISVDSWFNNNITGANRSQVADNTVFCADRSFRTGNTGSGLNTGTTLFAAPERISGTGLPTLICPRVEDRLILPVALITLDEVNMAGGRGGISNNNSFLVTNAWYWTMTPFDHGSGGPRVNRVNAGGIMSSAHGTANSGGTRPVLSLNSNVVATGDGSTESPFIVQS